MTFDKPAFKGEDFDFALGSVKGLRSWQIDDKGRLRGITHPAIWLPGDNVAICKAKSRCPKAKSMWEIEYSMTPTLGPRALDSKACQADGCDGLYHPTDHTFDPSCECGFWAYDEAGFEPHGQVTGVIEGFGRTTIGTKGFRCEKARVVALARENNDGALTLSEWLRLKQLYPDASFHDDVDDMVLAHGAVLRTWPAVGEDFWTETNEEPVLDSVRSQMSALNAQIARMSAAMTYSSPRSWRIGGTA